MSTPRSLARPSGGSFDCGEDDPPLVDGEREQLHVCGERPVQPVGEVVGADDPDDLGEVGRRVGVDGHSGKHHRPSLRSFRRLPDA
jgi:hypothetical protein